MGMTCEGWFLIVKDIKEIHESPEIEVIKTPEKKIDTFDDLRTSDKPVRIDTFDDIRADSWAGDKPTKIESAEKAMKETPATIEQKRLDQAVEAIKNIEEMKPEKWKTLSKERKIWVLDQCGKALRDAYNHPNPPLFTERTNSNKLGDYGDGWSYKKTAIYARDYRITLNEEGINEMNKKLSGDDPRVALETYTHEFRHSYQCEQAHAFDQGLQVDDPEKAQEWSGNLGKNYKLAPDPETAKADPEKYIRDYEEYKNQPVEKDAREFESKISSKIYGDVEKR
jgi:hypothetical protein